MTLTGRVLPHMCMQHTNNESDEEDAGSVAPVDLNEIRWRTAQTIVTVPQETDYIPYSAPGRAPIEYGE